MSSQKKPSGLGETTPPGSILPGTCSDSTVHTRLQGPLKWSSETLCGGPSPQSWNPATPASVLLPTVVWVTVAMRAQGASREDAGEDLGEWSKDSVLRLSESSTEFWAHLNRSVEHAQWL